MASAVPAFMLLTLLAFACFLLGANSAEISAGALEKDSIPCGRGAAANCRPQAVARAYSKGCSEAEHCRSMMDEQPQLPHDSELVAAAEKAGDLSAKAAETLKGESAKVSDSIGRSMNPGKHKAA